MREYVKRNCDRCNVTYVLKENRSQYCYKCRSLVKIEQSTGGKTIGHYRSKNTENGHRSWLLSEIRKHCRTMNKHRIDECQACGYARRVERCHVRGLAEWPDETLVSVINHPDNVLILCPNHHTEFDNKKHPEWRKEVLRLVADRESK